MGNQSSTRYGVFPQGSYTVGDEWWEVIGQENRGDYYDCNPYSCNCATDCTKCGESCIYSYSDWIGPYASTPIACPDLLDSLPIVHGTTSITFGGSTGTFDVQLAVELIGEMGPYVEGYPLYYVKTLGLSLCPSCCDVEGFARDGLVTQVWQKIRLSDCTCNTCCDTCYETCQYDDWYTQYRKWVYYNNNWWDTGTEWRSDKLALPA